MPAFIGVNLSLTETMILTPSQPNGAEKAVDALGDLTDKEKKLLEACIGGLKGNIEKGVNFVKNPPQK